MTFRVHMLGLFKQGTIKKVYVPENAFDSCKYKHQILEKIWYYGQNDLDPRKSYKNLPSVGLGDVIEYEDEYYDVLPQCFYKFKKEDFNKLKGARVRRNEVS